MSAIENLSGVEGAEKIKPSLVTLPEELLRHLIKIIDRQDERTQTRMTRYDLSVAAQEADTLCEGLYQKDPVIGVSALSQTCRKLRMACCPFLFNEMRSRQFFRPTLRRGIALLHAQHIKSLVISPVPPVLSKDSLDMEDLVYAASSLPNLVQLKIVQGAVQPPPRDPDDHRAQDPIFGVLRGVLSRIKILELSKFDCTRSLASFISLAPNITRLRLRNFTPKLPETDDEQDEEQESAFNLSRALQSIRELTHLAVIDSVDLFQFLNLNGYGLLEDWTIRLRLTSFYYQSDDDGCSADLVAFTRSQAPTLRRFGFFLPADLDFDNSLDVLNQTFPELQYLSLRGRFTNRFSLRNSIGSSTDFPKVKTVDIHSCSSASDRIPPPDHIVTYLPSLHTISYSLLFSEVLWRGGVSSWKGGLRRNERWGGSKITRLRESIEGPSKAYVG
ncbi:hypothetical protein JCM3765_004849 [Sporobolomyces pararoseus]